MFGKGAPNGYGQSKHNGGKANNYATERIGRIGLKQQRFHRVGNDKRKWQQKGAAVSSIPPPRGLFVNYIFA